MTVLKKQTAVSTPNKNKVALKAFFAISEKWKLTSDQERILLGVPKATFYRWKQHLDGTLPADTLERISYVLGIYKDLQILLPSEALALKWIHQPNTAPLFGGQTALAKMLKGRVIDLADVRRYLDAERG